MYCMLFSLFTVNQATLSILNWYLHMIIVKKKISAVNKPSGISEQKLADNLLK